jgi:hypothetical protein
MREIEAAWREEMETPAEAFAPRAGPDPVQEALRQAALEAAYEAELWRVARSMMSEPYPRGFGRQGTRRRATDGRWRPPTPSAQRAARQDAYLFVLGKGPRVWLTQRHWQKKLTKAFAGRLSEPCREWWLKQTLDAWPRDKEAREDMRANIPAVIRPHEFGLTLTQQALEMMYRMTKDQRFGWRVTEEWRFIDHLWASRLEAERIRDGERDPVVRRRLPPWQDRPEVGPSMWDMGYGG